MKRNVLALGAAAVIAGLPIAAVMAGGGESDAAPSTPRQSVTSESTDGSTASDDPVATAETSTSASTAPRPPLPIPVPVPGGGDDDDDGYDDDDDADDDDADD